MGNTQKLGTLINGLTVDANGNVGLGGAANASYKLAVTGAASFSSTILSGGTISVQTAAGTAPKFYLGQTATAAWSITNNASANTLSIIDEQFSLTRFLISGTGNIGIGTSSPTDILTIETTNNILTQRGGTGYSIYRSYAGDGTTANLVEFQIRNRVDGSNMVSVGTFSNHDLTFRTANTERMRVTSDGKLKLTSTTTGGTNLDMYLLENDGLYINSNEGATGRNIYFQTGGTERLNISGSTGYATFSSAVFGRSFNIPTGTTINSEILEFQGYV